MQRLEDQSPLSDTYSSHASRAMNLNLNQTYLAVFAPTP
jgi:hypothetical protein